MTCIALAAVPVCALLSVGCVADRRDAAVEFNAEHVSTAENVTPAPERRQVAFTFDDLPMSRDGTYGLKRMGEVTSGLLAQLQSEGITAVGFVNEIKLDRGNDRVERIALLEHWLDAGMELGNHGYAHRKFWDTPLELYERDVLRGERVIRPLLASKGQRPRYFRHPYLNTGRTSAAKTAFEHFLSELGYTVAPVTIDNMDVTYALAYDNAQEAGDETLKQRIAAAYVDHLRATFIYFEQLSRNLLSREPPQILMLHANALNADHLHAVVAMLRQRGYVFIPLESALRDSAYTLPDTFIGPTGPSWLQRWAMSQGRDPGREPRPPEWIERVAYP